MNSITPSEKTNNSDGDDIQKEIPQIIYICHKDIKCLQMTYNNWRRLNPSYQIKLFNDNMCENFLLNQFSELHMSIFKFIPDGPIKSDFWRLCILYKYGGIYVDADIHPFISLDKYLIRSCNFVTCITTSNNNFNPHFIATQKNNIILKQCIDEYINLYHHHKQSYAYWNWSIVTIFNKFLQDVKDHYKKTPQQQVFYLKKEKYQLFFETKKEKNNGFIDEINFIKPKTLHDYYCTFLNKRIFNSRYLSYDPHKHKFKIVKVKKNRKIKKIFLDV